MTDTFYINNLGEMKYIVSIVDFDYPRTFVCKRNGIKSVEIFLFDEYNHGDDYVEWLCVQISIDDLDRLNRGLSTLESCFYGPRNSGKNGYKVVSKKYDENATAVNIDNISTLVVNQQTFVDPFITDSHGADLFSLVYDTPIVAAVIKPEKYADPMIDSTRVTSSSNDFKAMINSFPFAIETRNNRMCISPTHSLVLYFEVSDKKIVGKDQLLISKEFDNNKETHEAMEAIRTVLNPNSTDEQIINAFKGDIKSIEKTRTFITEIKRNNKDKTVMLQAVDYSSNNNKGFESVFTEISTDIVKNTNIRCDEVVQIINKDENHIYNTFKKTGQFLMLDTTGRKKFKFQSTEKDDDGFIYSGFSDTAVNGLMVDDDRKKKYTVSIKSDILEGEFGRSKPIYTLLSIDRIEDSPEQLSLVD